MTKHTLTALALGSCTLGLLCSCDKQTPPPTAQEETISVKTFKIKKQQVTDYGEWFGYLRGKNDTDIHPRVSGFLISQEYKDGQKVKKGDVLFRIDPALFEAELAQAEANLKAAEAALVSAMATRDQLRLDVARYEQLVKTSAASEKQVSDARHKLRAAEASVKAGEAGIEQNKAAVSNARINLEYTVVRAPYDGIVGTALASKGDLVSAGTRLANITSIDPIRVDFSVNSDGMVNSFRRFGNVQSDKKNPALNSPAFDLILEDGSTYPYKGTLLSMESKVSNTGLIDVEGEIANPESLLRGGMPVRVKIPLGNKEALLVPAAAIRPVLRNNFIIVADRKGVPHTIPVVVDGKYDITITEEDGYTSTQKLVAIKDYARPLADYFREFGYENTEDVPVVADPDNGVRAMNISSANSRLAKDDPTPRGTIKTIPFSFRPTLSPAEKKALEKARGTAHPTEPQAKKAVATLPPFPVEVLPLVQQDVAMQNEWFGTLRGEEETDIRPQVSGFLLSQNFRNGTIVKKGDVLYTIDPAPYQAALARARANLMAAQASQEQAQATLDQSKSDLDRYNRLVSGTPGAVSDKTVTDARTAVQTNEAAVHKAEAAVAQAEAAVRLAEINLGYTIITAPFDGRVGISKPSIGALVSPSDQQPLVTISSINPIRVDFSVSGKGALESIEALQQHKVSPDKRPQFDLVLKDGSVYPAKGEIVSMDNALSTTTGTFGLVGRVENVDQGLRSGMPVRVRAAMNTLKGAFLVPARAPLNSEGRDLLLLLSADNTPTPLPITKGELVVIPVKEDGGKETVQPMYVVDVDRSAAVPLMLAKTKATSLDAMILGKAQVDSWDALVLKNAGVADFRALLEKQAGKSLPDELPEQELAADWKALALRRAGVKNTKELVLNAAGAKDELELIAQSQGFGSAMEMMLKSMGFDDIRNVPVIVEGTLTAASQTLAVNMKVGQPVNKLTPKPFHYKAPRTVVDSVTADADTSIAPQFK
ncbi:MAG: efflux RND transporter periplasmic adaptor subunit [Akkermansia sp.]|nr:efflux RND transporter periplasmic adaptor subunit [Akkermansia sp.]